jgi:phosphoenolpyruvate carboxykinase (ATP)
MNKINKITTQTISASSINLEIENNNIYRNLSATELYQCAFEFPDTTDPNCLPYTMNSTGALVAYSGLKTGRSPKDKRIVLDENTKDDIWWEGNRSIEPSTWDLLEERAKTYLSSKERLYVVDGYAGWDKNHRIRVRIVCSRPYHALFMSNMLIMPNHEELKEFINGVDYTVWNSGEFPATKLFPGVTSDTCVALNFTKKQMVILGTQYAGEMKKGVFTIMHYVMPKQGILSLHSSANVGENGDVTLLFGLSGTGKTTLSADPKRSLIGDDEHCWSNDGVFNIEGGCYAKCVNLSKEKEPEIYNAIKFGSVLENIKFYDDITKEVNYDDISITENTRVSYPLNYIENVKLPAISGHPKNILFLTCDAYGVLPPISKLNSDQAMYHFISGYTAKVSGTEEGVKEPTSTFSACFGEAFLPLHPAVYAQMLAEKMKKHDAKVWLINTGWTGGKYGVGKRISLKYTRRIVDAIHDGELDDASFKHFKIFGFEIPDYVSGIPENILNPEETWVDKEEYNTTLKNLAMEFQKNFRKYEDKASVNTKNAGPTL